MHRLLLLDSHGGSETSSSGGDGYLRDMNFDANMVIILAALLCALILALGLNSILRCAMGCGFGLSSSGATTMAADRTGLKKRELNKFPVAAYGSSLVNIAATECAICLGEFSDGERVRVLPPCNHSFHMSCIDTWLVSHSSCPNCRHSLIPA
ncbi:PREDICTED: RING-H2 finger protein ATL74 [Camelina sativa]|uniref:RING-type E3 ubiquitin transferase n=1 Tax=Camelina sativa TaxID=90675 RepID=A0ABM0V708_CAMSA|nr:PREDICTED: RING-H2 finger protein ATL74 [Camelina sativa]